MLRVAGLEADSGVELIEEAIADYGVERERPEDEVGVVAQCVQFTVRRVYSFKNEAVHINLRKWR